MRVLREADDSTSMDPQTGAVRSVQSAEVVLPTDRIDSLWSPLYLERLARTYWRFLSRAAPRPLPAPHNDPQRAGWPPSRPPPPPAVPPPPDQNGAPPGGRRSPDARR